MRRRSIGLVALALGASALGVSATAGATVSAHAATTTLTLRAGAVNGSFGAVISDARWTVRGSLSRYRPGQHISIHVFDDGKRIMTRTVAVARRGSTGAFHLSLRIGAVGRVTVRAVHTRAAGMPALVSRAVSIWVVAPIANPGEHSYSVRILQAQLSALHYVAGAPGVYDERTQRAVLAFRKMTNLPRTMVADATVFDALAAGKGAFPVQFPSHGRHVEGDLTHQVLALIGAGGNVEALYPMSSGKPSTPTVLGSFKVYLKTPGINDKGMVDLSYFYLGDAIHGYAEVPPSAASHGCLRVPVPDALTIYGWATVGTPVDVYYR
ncbi:MAG: L,D-transpeptidase family protein [Solirubrobacteraceae bacterium]